MRIFSDFRIFEKPPRPGRSLFRWIAWRWLVFSILFLLVVALFVGVHFAGDQPIHYTNENRALTDEEIFELIRAFLSVGGLFFILGLAGVMLIPKD